MEKFLPAFKKACATFIFASTGCLIGFNVMDVDVEVWKTAVGTGLGALVNLAYRWSESALKERNAEG